MKDMKCKNCKCNDIRADPKTETVEPTAEMIELSTLAIPENLYYAICVMNGRFGAGEERKASLGTKYNKVQEIVNTISAYWE